MTTAIIIDSLLFIILLVLVILKTKHFYTYISSKRRSLVNWFYFGHNTVVRSSSSKSIANKRKQNSYSIRIGVMLVIISCAIVLEFLLFDQPLPNAARPSERPNAPTIKR